VTVSAAHKTNYPAGESPASSIPIRDCSYTRQHRGNPKLKARV